MWPPIDLPFGQQRIVFSALLFAVIAALVIVAVLVHGSGPGLAAEPMPELDTVAVWFGAISLVAGLLLHRGLHRAAAATAAERRRVARFRATALPLAVLVGGCLVALVAWMQNGNPRPGLIVALVLLSVMISLIPLRDPDAGR